MILSWLLPLGSLALADAAGEPGFKAKCEGFKGQVHIPGSRVNYTQFVPSGQNVSIPDNVESCGGPLFQGVYGDICRVQLIVNTSSTSQSTVEAWLPKNFTGRHLSVGNGGLGGCIEYNEMGYGSGLGFATIGTNNGHDGQSGAPFLNHPEVIKDFAYRSMHTATVVGKQVTDIFYGQGKRKKSYYLGCSTGGRQGIKSADMYPDDFDGIVAGSPAIKFTSLVSWSMWLNTVTGFNNETASFVTEALWSLVHDEILRQCDGIDGAVDGIIEDPDLCHPNFTPLLCGSSGGASGSSTACLNGEQLRRVDKVFTPFSGLNSTIWYPRMQPGSELLAYAFMYAGVPFPYSTDWLRYVVYNDSSFAPTKVVYKDFVNLVAQNPANIETFPSSLAAFQKKGGKLVTFHGMADELISSEISELYYNHLTAGMELSPSELDNFYRYFRISGMYHCGSGPGAWSVGQFQAGGVIGDPATLNPQDNVLLAVTEWVEKGVAPEFIRGTKYNNDNIDDGVAFRRKHCKFPARNVYVGPGNYTDEDAWQCILHQGQELIKQMNTGSD